MCKNIVEWDRPQMRIWLMRIACWITKATNRHGKLFIGRPCKKRADDLLRLSRPELKMVVTILRGHAPVRRHLNIMRLFDGVPSCRFCRMETETVQHIIC
jgi:hypothetical protein